MDKQPTREILGYKGNGLLAIPPIFYNGKEYLYYDTYRDYISANNKAKNYNERDI